MFEFLFKLLDLISEWYKGRKERAMKRWLEFDDKYNKKRPSMDDANLDTIARQLREKNSE